MVHPVFTLNCFTTRRTTVPNGVCASHRHSDFILSPSCEAVRALLDRRARRCRDVKACLPRTMPLGPNSYLFTLNPVLLSPTCSLLPLLPLSPPSNPAQQKCNVSHTYHHTFSSSLIKNRKKKQAK